MTVVTVLGYAALAGFTACTLAAVLFRWADRIVDRNVARALDTFDRETDVPLSFFKDPT
jgi:hypothetical protein